MNPKNMMESDLRAELSAMERRSPDGYTEGYLEGAIEDAEDRAWDLEQEICYLRDQQKKLRYTDPRASMLIEELECRAVSKKYNLSIFEVLEEAPEEG